VAAAERQTETPTVGQEPAGIVTPFARGHGRRRSVSIPPATASLADARIFVQLGDVDDQAAVARRNQPAYECPPLRIDTLMPWARA